MLTFRARVRPTGEEGAGQWSLWKGPESPACPIQAGFFPAPDPSSGEAGDTCLLRVPASALSLWLLAHKKLPLYRALGKWEEARGIAQAQGLDSGADKRLAQSSHRWALLSGTGGPCLLCLDIGALTP